MRDPLATLNPRAAEPRQGPVHIPTREEALIEEKTRVEGTLHGWADDFLASNRAGYITGAAINVDGGVAPVL